MKRLLLTVAGVLNGWAQEKGLLLEVPSPVLKAPLRCEVFLPALPGGRVPRGLPVVLLLHGGGGHAADFRALGAATLAMRQHLILVALEGGTTAFLDAATDPQDRPAQAMGDALFRALEQRFAISQARQDRALFGVSLGGFAALSAGCTQPTTFGFVASLSAVVEWPQWGPMELNALPMPLQSLYRRAFGAPEDPARLRFDLFQRLASASPAQRRDWPFFQVVCGTEDLFLSGNQRWVEALAARGVAHAFRQGPGLHDAPYWAKALPEALQAFHQWRRLPKEKGAIR